MPGSFIQLRRHHRQGQRHRHHPSIFACTKPGDGHRLMTSIASCDPGTLGHQQQRRRNSPLYPAIPLKPDGSKENRNGTRYLGSRRRWRRHSGHSRRDGGPGRPAAHELHGLGDLPDRAGGLGDRGLHRRDRRPAVPVRLAAGQGHHPQPVRRPVRLPGRDQHRDRRLRPGLAGRQDRPPQGPDPVRAAGRGVHLAVRVRDQLPGADRLVDRRHARVRRVPGHQRRVHERDHGPERSGPGS